MGVGDVARMWADKSGCHKRSHVGVHNLTEIEQTFFFKTIS